MDIKKLISNESIIKIKNGIKESGNNEVFFTGLLNDEGVVTSVEIGARGNIHEVPVNFENAKKSEVLIHNHPGGSLVPSDADLSVAAHYAENGCGFYIINNSVSDIYVVVEPVLPQKKEKLDSEKTGEFLTARGPLALNNEKFEEREGQIELCKNIAKVFNENKLGIFEAGTGVGKSYAYLIPSVLWAFKNKERVIISTGTINLQQQLCEKDIPAVLKMLNLDLKYILMKGRQNFICKRRLNEAGAINDLFENDADEIKKIFEWANNSPSGDKSELTFMPSDSVWTRVNSESDGCMGMKCPYHSECFVMKLKKEAASANLIVVNHHLLFADIESRMNGAGYEDAAVLPPYKHIVFDEAHGIEAAATSFFSESFTRFKLNKMLNQMYRKRKSSESGHLITLALVSSNEDKVESAGEIVSKVKNAITVLEQSGKDLTGKEMTKRLYSQTARDFGPFLVAVSELAKNLGKFNDLVRIIIEGIEQDDQNIPAYWESKMILRRLDDYVILLKDFCQWDEKQDYVFWIQQKRLSPVLRKDTAEDEFIILNKTPLDISSLMNNGVYEEMDSVICTSATLKTGRDFNYWMNRTGFFFTQKGRVVLNEYSSPFPYEKNMIFAVPKDAPLPDSMEYQQYIEMALPKLIQAAEGRTLVLFTSYESLKSACATCKAVLRGFSGRIMQQGEDDPAKLLDAFKKEKESVLFATDSFWQGVDVPGESLSQVIIVKLPFTVPSDPVFVARSEAISKRGGNSFMELSIPEAVIKFRQGIGRLIRTKNDKGAVVVFDRRVYEKRYGSIFLASMPFCRQFYEPLDNIAKRVNDFIFD